MLVSEQIFLTCRSRLSGKRNALRHLLLAVLLSAPLLFLPEGLNAQTYSEVIKEGRDYKLDRVDGHDPTRVMEFRFYEKPTYTRYPAIMICGECLCVTGILLERYPKLLIKPTSGSPTYSCEWESLEFEQDGELAARLVNMTRIKAQGDVLEFSSDANDVMVFRMRSDMESCLNWFELEGELMLKNYCDDPVQVQFHAPNLRDTMSMKIAARATFGTGLNYGETDDFVFSACPINTEPTVSFDESGYGFLRARQYECH